MNKFTGFVNNHGMRMLTCESLNTSFDLKVIDPVCLADFINQTMEDALNKQLKDLGELQAVKAHLADVRKLLFDQLEEFK